MRNFTVGINEVHDGYTTETIESDTADDLYLTSAGFEDRTLAATDSLDEEYRADWGLIYVNSEYFELPNREKTKEHIEALKSKLKAHCETVDVVKGSWLQASSQVIQLREALSVLAERDSLNITVDVTTFNREALMVAFNILYSLSNNIITRILYISPNEYGDWLSEGHRMVRNVMGFAGLQNSHKPTLLIILSGFEQDRAINTIEAIEPAKLLVGTGNPPIKETFLDKNKERLDLVYSRQSTEYFEFPADSVQGSYERISNLLEEYEGEYNIILSPMSTKISTIGVWKAARKFNRTQVIYTIPGKYNFKDYSTGAETLYVDWI